MGEEYKLPPFHDLGVRILRGDTDDPKELVNEVIFSAGVHSSPIWEMTVRTAVQNTVLAMQARQFRYCHVPEKAVPEVCAALVDAAVRVGAQSLVGKECAKTLLFLSGGVDFVTQQITLCDDEQKHKQLCLLGETMTEDALIRREGD